MALSGFLWQHQWGKGAHYWVRVGAGPRGGGASARAPGFASPSLGTGRSRFGDAIPGPAGRSLGSLKTGRSF